MTNPRDIFLQQFKPALDDKENRYPPFRAVLTSSAGATDTGDVWKDENARLVWFRAWGGAAPAWALCDVLEPTLGLGVYIKFNPDINQYEVLRDDPLMRSPSSDRTSYRAITDQDLLKGGRFQLWLDPTMFIPLSIYPTAADTVNVVSGDYILGGERLTFAGAVGQDLSASRPAVGFHRFVGFYLDDSATLATIDGATVATGTDAIEPVWPAGVLRVGVVDIDNATAISIDNIDNRKVIYTEDDETGAINVWPRADEVNINFTPYAGWALAVDALDAGEQAIIGEGTYLSDNERIDVAAFIKGSGVDVSILSTTTKDRALELATDPIILEDFTLSNIYTATLYGDYYAAFIDENASIDAFRVKFVVTGSGGNINYGCYIASAGTHRFDNCIWDVRNGTANYAMYMDAQGLYSGAVVDLFDPDITGDVHNEDGTLNIYSGAIDGDLYAGDGSTITLYNPVITGTVSSHAGGTIYGQYQDSNGVTHYIEDTSPADGDVPTWSVANKRWEPGPGGGGGGAWPDDGEAKIGETAYATISLAIAAAAAGDEVRIGKGTYTEQLSINKDLTLVAADNSTVTVTNSTSPTVDCTNNSDVVLRNIEVIQNGTSAGGMTAVQVDSGSTLVAIRCKITGDCNGSGDVYAVEASGDTTLYNCEIYGDNATASTIYGVFAGGGTVRLVDTDVTTDDTSGAGTSVAIEANSSGITVVSGKILGSTYDVQIQAGQTVSLLNPQLLLNSINNGGTLQGWYFTSTGVLISAGSIIDLNGLADGFVGDADGDSSISAPTDDQWDFETGGSDRMTLTNSGLALASGARVNDITTTVANPGDDTTLITEASVWDILPTVRTPAEDIWQPGGNTSSSDFVSVIATLPGGAVLTYGAIGSGDEDNLTVNSSGQIAKVTLHNTTRGDSALISSTVTGTNTITLTAAVPGTWQVGDAITIRSQTNTSTAGGAYFVDMEFVSEITTEPYFLSQWTIQDSGGQGRILLHPFEANSTAKRRNLNSQVAGLAFVGLVGPIAVVSNKFCLVWIATGSNTLTNITGRVTLA